VAALVVSHWFLDLLMHRPDLPLAPGGSTRVGLGAWSSLPLTLLIEVPLFLVGAWLYARADGRARRLRRWGLWSLVAFLLLIHAANLFGGPPPNVEAIAWAGQLQWLLVIWATGSIDTARCGPASVVGRLSCGWRVTVVVRNPRRSQSAPSPRRRLEVQMDPLMKIDGDKVRALRERKAWSQEHLATASGLSVRTVQRVESEGSGLPETRLALAGALGVSAAELMEAAPLREVPPDVRPPGHRSGAGWAGAPASPVR
jgi:DNA-binding XRE family transcriptional regulator